MTENTESEIATLVRDVTTWVACPWCHEKAFDITSHLERDNQREYPDWRCPSCGQQSRVMIGAPVRVRKVPGTPAYDKLVLLCIPPQSAPIYLVVKA